MGRIANGFVALLVSVLLTACAFNEVSGQRVAGANSETAFRAVDVIFVDQATMTQSGIRAMIGAPAPQGLMSRASGDLPIVMRELRDGAVAALSENRVPGRALLFSERASLGPSSSYSHLVVVSMQSATISVQTATTFILNVEVLDAATRRSLWKGTSRVNPGASGWNEADRRANLAEKGRKFGEGLIQALRDSGAVLPGRPS